MIDALRQFDLRARRLGLLRPDQQRVANNFDRVGWNRATRGRAQRRAALEIKLRAVPGTDHMSILDHAVHQRAARVRAAVAQRVERAVHVEQRDLRAVHDH